MLLRGGVEAWNQWRKDKPDVLPDLCGANLQEADLSRVHFVGADLQEADLGGANLSGANLSRVLLAGAVLFRANLTGTDLSGADLREVELTRASLFGANLTAANLFGANLFGADLTRANLFRANLMQANCVQANLAGATLIGCNVYGISAWDVNLEGTVQADLRITPAWKGSLISVDHLEVAQFLYLIVHNEKMRAVLDTITSKVVLILGRFSDDRKPILDALREALRCHPNGYIPVLFDFEPQADKPILETVKTLANLARFVIADLTDPHMIRAELTAIVPNVPTVPVQPLIQEGAKLPIEYDTWVLYRSFLPLYSYADLPHLLDSLTESVITPVEAHVQARRL